MCYSGYCVYENSEGECRLSRGNSRPYPVDAECVTIDPELEFPSEEFDKPSLRCDDCGQFARADQLETREPWMSGLRHKHPYGCGKYI